MNFMWRNIFILGGACGFIAGCILPARAEAQSEPSISHRKILDNTCFFSTNSTGDITALSCVKD